MTYLPSYSKRSEGSTFAKTRNDKRLVTVGFKRFVFSMISLATRTIIVEHKTSKLRRHSILYTVVPTHQRCPVF